ncbi:MAG TPA: DUF664 domain-containing protein [Microlunatus sp.]|nr:DUF664 domain-containing protein [Microlunatus sp.]
MPPEHRAPARSVRTVLLHLIEETARRAGHLDVARELIDWPDRPRAALTGAARAIDRTRSQLARAVSGVHTSGSPKRGNRSVSK